ncbi:hypothetical protein RND71_015345 [Anisodus tanguticus]|uniref:HTH cro/C1-type domain-containing protein n=1 Tax=Anisodus tanguticus TaxID=243964 RepID=A0AAE1S6B1_9SOLA|nr:hypothetical protein RND71_015345 [Anisodus tanguticus]
MLWVFVAPKNVLPPPIIVNVHHNPVPPPINHPSSRNNPVIVLNQNEPRPPTNPVIVINQNKLIKLKDAILQARNKKNLSQVELAKGIISFTSQMTISKLEKVLEEKRQDLYKIKLREDIMQARKNMYMTQPQLAKKLKVKAQIIQDYENGRAIPNQKIITQLEKALGVN